jgi:hypothetical protein
MTNQITIHWTKHVTNHIINQPFNHVTNCPPWEATGRSQSSPVPSCPYRTAALCIADTMCLLRGTNLPTPCSTVLLEKLTGFQIVKKFPAFYGTRRFITAFTSARHLSLSSARPIQSTPSQPTSWRIILILSSHLRLARQELNFKIQTGKFWVLRVNYRWNREKHIQVRTSEILWIYPIFGHGTNVKFASAYIFR